MDPVEWLFARHGACLRGPSWKNWCPVHRARYPKGQVCGFVLQAVDDLTEWGALVERQTLADVRWVETVLA